MIITYIVALTQEDQNLGSWLRPCINNIYESVRSFVRPWIAKVNPPGTCRFFSFFLATPFVACKAFEATFVIFFITGLASTLLLSYLRVCGVWNWNPFIVGLFGISWISVVASGFAVINSIKGVEVDNYCEVVLVGQRVLAPVITTFFNHTIVFLAITFGVCKNTIGKDLSLGDCLRLMLGRRLPVFRKALLHDSQVCYMWVFFFFVFPEHLLT